MKVCSKCKEEKSDGMFNFKNKANNVRQSSCKDCTREAIRNHYNANKNYYLRKSKIRNAKNRKKIRNFVFNFLSSHPCKDCGENDPVVLEFDHIGEKEESISNIMTVNQSLQKVKKEIEKCEVRCANCHRRKTEKDFNWYKLNNMHP